MFYVNIIIWHVDINKSHVRRILLVDIFYLVFVGGISMPP